MPKIQDITCIINLKEIVFKELFVNEENALNIFLEVLSLPSPCPRCGNPVINNSELIHKQIRDLDVFGRSCYLEFSHARLECKPCRKRWMQPLDFVSDNCRYTRRFEEAVYELCRATNAKHAGEYFNLSDTAARDIYHRIAEREQINRQLLPMKKLGIDEIAMHKGHQSFIVIISDLTNKKVIEVLEERTKTSLEKYLSSLPEDVINNIETVSLDLWGPYHAAVKAILPNALPVADRFHVQQHLNKALDKCRRDIKKELNKDNKKFWAHGKYALLKNSENLTEVQKEALDRIINTSVALNKCYYFKEEFRAIFNVSTDVEMARGYLCRWIVKVFTSSDAIYYHGFVKTLLNWEEEVLNYFIDFTTSGFVEGVNNKIKLIKRTAFGFGNFENFRRKILDSFS